MTCLKIALALAITSYPCQQVFGQTIETQRKPPSVVFKDAAGAVVTSVPVDTRLRVPVVVIKVSAASNTAYLLNGSGKSKERSLSAVALSTQRVDRVIRIGEGNEVEMVMSQDGHRLFCQTVNEVVLKGGRNAWEHLQKRDHAGATITVIDTGTNEVLASYNLLSNPAAGLPKFKFIETFFSVTPDGERVLAKIDGFDGRMARTGRPDWVRLLVFSVKSPGSVQVVDPGAPVVSYKFSEDGKFLFVTAEDKDRHSGAVDVVDLEKNTTIKRVLENPPTRHERLGALLEGGAPAAMEPKQGMWAFTRGGLRFVSETGEIGSEISLPVEENVLGELSLDHSFFLLAFPGKDKSPGVLHVLDLKKGVTTSHPLTEAPKKLVRLGAAKSLWLIGSREMRSVSETGELADQAIPLNKPRKTEAGDNDNEDVFLDGYPGETITLGEDHAAILISNKRGGSLHRVALIDLKKLQVDSVVATMSKGEKSKIIAGRWLETLAFAAAAGAAQGAIGASAGIPPPNLFYIPLPEGLKNESLATPSDGKHLYVLDTDIHKVSVIDVQTGSVSERIPVNNSVTAIQVARDGKHLECAGQGFLQTVGLEVSK